MIIPEKNCFTCMHRVNVLCMPRMKSILNGYDFCNEYSHTLSVDSFSSAYVAQKRQSVLVQQLEISHAKH